MTAQDQESFDTTQDKHFLPKEPLDLPKEPLDLPREPQEIPAQIGHIKHHPKPNQNTYPDSHNVKTLLAWTAPGRPFKKRNREYFVTSLLIMLLCEIVAFLFAQYLLMLAILALVFVAFTLSTVPPHDFHNRISSEGITIEKHFYLWQELYDFYFKRKNGMDILHIRTHGLPGELTITLGDISKEHIKAVLLPYLPFREVVTPTFMEKAGDWLAKTFPLERHAHNS